MKIYTTINSDSKKQKVSGANSKQEIKILVGSASNPRTLARIRATVAKDRQGVEYFYLHINDVCKKALPVNE